MVWATPRKPPIRAKLLLLAQPANSKGYNPKPSTSKSKINLNSWALPRHGRNLQPISLSHSAKAGASRKTLLLVFSGCVSSLRNSLTASEIGCNSPPTLTLLGPFRACLKPRIFRSRRVKKATFTRALMITVMNKQSSRVIAFKTFTASRWRSH